MPAKVITQGLPPKPVPQVETSPLRIRLQQRIEENKKKPEKKPESKKKMVKKIEPEVKPEVKKIPKVYASPSWYKSPGQRKIQMKNKQFDELRELLRKDGNNTEEGINKIINDLKF
jgi:stalled ribosome rescue protein Dom34